MERTQLISTIIFGMMAQCSKQSIACVFRTSTNLQSMPRLKCCAERVVLGQESLRESLRKFDEKMDAFTQRFSDLEEEVLHSKEKREPEETDGLKEAVQKQQNALKSNVSWQFELDPFGFPSCFSLNHSEFSCTLWLCQNSY